MTSRIRTVMLLASAGMALAVTACGGGGGQRPQFTPAPPPQTPPPPPPPPLTSQEAVKIFPAVTSSTTFATLADNVAGDEGVSVRYDADTGLYLMDFPSTEEGAFYQAAGNTPSERLWNGFVSTNPNSTDPQAGVTVYKPAYLGLSYATFAYGPGTLIAFGLATPAGSVPVSGSATYSAKVEGSAPDAYAGIGGSATLNFDFSAGTLSGVFNPTFRNVDVFTGIPLGTYSFVNTVFGVGSPTYSGELHRAGLSGNGAFQGLFTGPSAQELIARWNAPYISPITQQQLNMQGIWVGKSTGQ